MEALALLAVGLLGATGPLVVLWSDYGWQSALLAALLVATANRFVLFVLVEPPHHSE